LSLVDSGPTRITTSTSTTLDRFIVSDITVANHELVMLSLGYTKPSEEPVVKYVRNYRRIGLPALEAELDWTSVFSSADIDSKVKHLLSFI
jgi:hypothetical protein